MAWAAGFFDGEGCTYLGHHGVQKLPVPCLELNQADDGTLTKRFQKAVAGIGFTKARPDRAEHRSRPLWSWYVRNWRDTQAVLTLLWPYLGTQKRAQAAMRFTEYQKAVRRNPRIGRPNMSALWTATTCPLGHTDIETRPSGRRCRTCRREGTRRGYATV